MKRTSRATSKLSEAVHHQLKMYALAAGAAGVSAIALAPPADAEIVYTKAHVVIPPGRSYDLDLNHDGIGDFTLSNAVYSRRALRYSTVRVWVGGLGQSDKQRSLQRGRAHAAAAVGRSPAAQRSRRKETNVWWLP